MRDYLPTPKQIRQGCAEIQAGWSADVEANRRCNPCRIEGCVNGWRVPGYADDSAGVRLSIVFDRQ